MMLRGDLLLWIFVHIDQPWSHRILQVACTQEVHCHSPSRLARLSEETSAFVVRVCSYVAANISPLVKAN